MLVLERLESGYYGELKGLNLVYINYSICNEDEDIENWQRLAAFQNNVGVRHSLQDCVMDVLY
jgi:hypothetical protein